MKTKKIDTEKVWAFSITIMVFVVLFILVSEAVDNSHEETIRLEIKERELRIQQLEMELRDAK